MENQHIRDQRNVRKHLRHWLEVAKRFEFDRVGIVLGSSTGKIHVEMIAPEDDTQQIFMDGIDGLKEEIEFFYGQLRQQGKI